MSSGEETLGQPQPLGEACHQSGSGSCPIEGAVNLDVSPSIGADVIRLERSPAGLSPMPSSTRSLAMTSWSISWTSWASWRRCTAFVRRVQS
jgi:hypothetical protein